MSARLFVLVNFKVDVGGVSDTIPNEGWVNLFQDIRDVCVMGRIQSVFGSSERLSTCGKFLNLGQRLNKLLGDHK